MRKKHEYANFLKRNASNFLMKEGSPLIYSHGCIFKRSFHFNVYVLTTS